MNIKDILKPRFSADEFAQIEALEILEGFEAIVNKLMGVDTVDMVTEVELLIYHINSSIVSMIEDSEFKWFIKSLIAKVARILIYEIKSILAENEFSILAVEVNKAIEKSEYIYGYNGQELRDFLQIESFIEKKEALIPPKIAVFELSMPEQKLGWCVDKRFLKRLAEILCSDYDCIKSKNEFIEVFDNDVSIKSKKRVRWNPDKIGHLAYLLHCLYKKDKNPLGKCCFKAEGKGYFQTAQIWFEDYSNNPIKKLLRKLSSDITKKPHLYEREITDIKAIMQECAKK